MIGDVLQALRQTARTPAFCILVVLMLAVGIGATTAVYSSFQTVVMRALPVPDPGRLVNLSVPGRHLGSTTTSDAGNEADAFSYPMFRDLQRGQTAFTGIAGHVSFPASVTRDRRTQAGTGMLVSGSYFDVLDLRPVLGRLIDAGDESAEAAVAVLSHQYWTTAFAGDEDVVGRRLTVNGAELTIVGVAPAGFTGTTLGTQPQVFVPLTLRWQLQPGASGDATRRFDYWVYLFARLQPGVTVAQASASIDGLHRAILRDVEEPLLSSAPAALTEPFLERQLVVEPGALGQSVASDSARMPLTLLLGLTAIVQLIVCVNVANLLLARGLSRAGEMTIRKSLGASHSRLLRQLLIESSLLAMAAGLLSLPVASLTAAAIGAMSPAQLAGDLGTSLDGAMLLFAGGATFATLMLFGLVPAVQVARSGTDSAVRTDGSRTLGGRGTARLRGVLTSVQIAFSAALLVLAGLFAQSLGNVARVDLGMQVDSVVTFDVSAQLSGYDADRAAALAAEIEDAIGARADVTSVASSRVGLLVDDYARGPVGIEGVENAPGEDVTAWFNAVSRDYFRTLSIGLLSGRTFGEADTPESARVAVVNERFVAKFALGGRAVGTHFTGADRQDFEIVGVVADAKYADVKGDVPPQYYMPQSQFGRFEALTFYVRAARDPEAFAREIPRIVAGVDAGLPVDQLKTMRRIVRDNVYLDRMIALLSVAFAALAVLLAAIGLYGVLAYNVSQRTRELGLRQALGATRGRLVAMVLRQAGVLALLGVPVGLVVAAALGRAAQSLLYGLSGNEPAIFAAATVVLLGVLLAAGSLPARHASRVSPMQALRDE